MPVFPRDPLERHRRELETTTAARCAPELDTVLGLEVIRRGLGLSKGTFYSEVSPTLPVVTLSPRRRGVRRSDFEAWLAASTRDPIASIPQSAKG